MTAGSCTVIIPTYNEEGNVVAMASDLRGRYPEFDIVFMDDNSEDRSGELIRALGDPKVSFVTRDPCDRGLSASIFQGISGCATDYFIVMDCDFQHPPEILADIYAALEGGSDLVIGVRNDRASLGFVRWAGSWAFTVFTNLFLLWHGRTTSKDTMSGLFGGRTAVFACVVEDHAGEMERKGWKALLDLLRFAPPGLAIAHVDYRFGKRAAGESKMNPAIVLRTFNQCGIWGRFFGRVYGGLKKVRLERCPRNAAYHSTSSTRCSSVRSRSPPICSDT